MDDSQLKQRTLDWIASDPDAQTREELNRLLEANDLAELAERMAGTLEFGTAGLRGRVEAGSNRMNRAVVITTTAGLASYLVGRFGAPLVVVGRDARLSSEQFMEDTVAVLAAAGIHVIYFPEPVSTPLVAHVALQREASAAIVITASHNPPQDNGYKVYDINGAQIVPPVDTDIAAAIAVVGRADAVPLHPDPYSADNVVAVVPEFLEHYLADLSPVRHIPNILDGVVTNSPATVFSSMHGVGGRYLMDVFAATGHGQVDPVPEQHEPDGHFPTVAFPNPEEPGALDLAIAQATASHAELIVANDPDTDRLAVAIPDPQSDTGWRVLTGNQIGILLADHVLATTTVERPMVLNSIVSTPMLGVIAAAYGALFETTFTGFKWVWNAALDLQAAGKGTYVFGFEEALGYSVGPAVRDKDGISAAVHFLDLASMLRTDGTNVLRHLEQLYRTHGLWVSIQHSEVRIGTEGAAAIAAAMERLGHEPPAMLGGEPVLGVVDFSKDGASRPRYRSTASLIELDLGGRGRVLVRPSGTEPKLKIYVDLTTPLTDGAMQTAEAALLAEARKIALEMVELLQI